MVAIGTFKWALVFAPFAECRNLMCSLWSLVFAWDNAKRIRARKHIDDQGFKHYEIYGPLFGRPS